MKPFPHHSIQRDFARLSRVTAPSGEAKARREARRFVAWAHPRSDSHVLEAACGTGTLAQAFTSVSAHVTGIDLVPPMIRAAARAEPASLLPRLTFSVGNIDRLPYPDRSFDLVTCTYAFANIPDPLRVLREFSRVTRRTGRIAIADVLASEDHAQCACLNHLEALRGHIYTRILKHSEFLEVFQRAHLRVESCRLRRQSQSLRQWLRLSPAAAAPQRAALLRRMVLDSARDDSADLRPRRVRGDFAIHHSTAWFLLCHK